MKKKNFAVIYYVSCDDLAFAVATSIMSYEKTNSNLIDNYIIFTDKYALTKETRNLLMKISDKIIFRDFTKEYMESIINMEEKWVNKTYLIYSTAFCIDYLKEYKNVLHSGADVLAVDDISDLLDTGPLSWKPTVVVLNQCLQIDSDDVYTKPNGDFVFMTDELEKYSSKDMIEILNKYSYKMSSPNEFIYGMFAYLNNIKVNLLTKFNRGVISGNFDEGKVIHAGSRFKFWKYNVMNTLLPEFNKYYQKWLSLGGKGYDGPREGPVNFPEQRNQVIPWLYTIKTFVQFNDILYYDLPTSILPSLETYNRRIPFFIRNKNKIMFYYVYFHYKRSILHIGFLCRRCGPETDQLMNKLHDEAGENFTIDIQQRKTVIYKSYNVLVGEFGVPDSCLKPIAKDFLLFINKTLPDVLESSVANVVARENSSEQSNRLSEENVSLIKTVQQLSDMLSMKDDEAEARIKALTVRADQLEKKIRKMKSSFSWRITKPLRAIHRFFKSTVRPSCSVKNAKV